MPAPPLKANTGYVSPTDLDAVIRETDWEAFQAFPRTDCEYETFKGLLRDEETRLKMVELLTSTPPHLDQFRALFSEDMATLDAPLIRTLKTEASKKDDGNLTDIRVGNGKKRPYRPKNRMNCRLKAWFDWRALSGPPQQRFELVFGEPTNDGFCTVSVVWQPIAYDATATRIPGIPVGRLPRKSEPAWAVVIELRCLGELNTEIQSELWNTFHEIHDPPRARAARIPKASETADPSREFHRNPKSVLNDSGDNEGANADTWDYRGLPDGLSATLPLGDNGCVRQKVTDAVRFARLLSDLPALKAQKTTIAVDLCDVRGLQREVDGQLLGWRRNVARAAVLASHLAEEQAAEARIRKMSAKIERQFQKKLDELRNGRVIDGGTAGKIRLTEDALSKCMHEAVAENPTCLQFVKMHGALDDEPSSCLLVTAQVERIIRHWYSCEPVGVIDDTTVHRVWCRTAALRDNEIDNYVDSRLPDGECAPIVDVDVSDEQAALAAQSAVPYSASIDTNVLLWRCDRNRKFDLLTPVTESLRDLFDLRDYSTDSIKSRINDFSESAVELLELARWTWTGGEKLVNPVSAGYGQQPQEISGIDQLRSLLIGSKFDGNFRNIVNVLYNLLFHFNKHDLRIVVSNPQHADELTARLLKLLMDAAKGRHLTLLAKPSEKTAKLTIVLCGQHGFGRSTEVLPFEWSKAGEQDDPHRTPEEFPKVVIDRLLLQIASVLGVSFLRDWLRRVAKRMGVSDDGFRLALARLVEAGVLRYSGYLRDPGEEKRRFRELSFSSSSVFETIRGSVEQQDQNEVRQAFLAEVLDKIVNHGIDTVRHKIRVCEILGGTANGRGTEDIVKALLGEVGAKALAELWWMAGSRARHAGAPIEAMKRLMNASHLIRAFNLQQNATTRRLALRVLVHRVAVCEDRIAESDDPDSMQQAKRDAMQQLEDARQSRITFGKANDLDLDEENGLFALHRRCWSYHNRHGSLSEAKDWAQSLLDRSNSGVFSDNRLKLELRHILCVVSFSMGLLDDCIQFGDDGKAFCKDIEKSAPKARKYDNSDMFGGHCGGVCCKSFLALAHLLHGDNTTADKIRLEAAAYAKDQDDTSRLIARAYTRMYRIFQHDFVVALDNELIISGEYADEGPPAAGYWAAKITRAVTIDDASGDWRVFDNLVRACAYVGCCWERCRNSTLNENDKNDIQALCRAFEVLNREWNSKECLSLWGTYEAVAWALLREDDRANELFRTTSEKALAREEKFYLPELYRLWSECLQRRGDTRAEEKRQDGLQFAAGMPLFERWLKSPG